jgi:hypothetical protein
MKIQININDDCYGDNVHAHAYLELRVDESNYASLQLRESRSSYGTPAEEWIGRVATWSTDTIGAAIADEAKIKRIAAEIHPLVERFIVGREVDLDDHDRGQWLQPDAIEAREELDDFFRQIYPEDWAQDVQCWTVEDWFAESPELCLEQDAAQHIEDAKNDRVHLLGGNAAVEDYIGRYLAERFEAYAAKGEEV